MAGYFTPAYNPPYVNQEHATLNICILAAGAAGMYCGSCLRDNALAGALLRARHRVTLVPLYTPLRTDAPTVTIPRVFFGGINAWLQYASPIFRHTPRLLDWLFDRPWLLTMAGSFGAQTPPAKLGPFVLSILSGEHGPQIKELRRLVRFVADDLRPQVISLPNLMFIGMARLLHQDTGAPIVCELTGEDIFLDAMVEPYRTRARDVIRQRSADVARFVATSSYYAGRMSDYLAIPREQISVVYPGISRDHLRSIETEPAPKNRPPTIGYFARICPEKGLDKLVDALHHLHRLPGMAHVQLRAAGYLGLAHRAWYDALRKRIAREGLAHAFTYVGEVDLPGKLAFLDSIDVLSVPTPYAEPKGIYVLEALARGVPVVQPDHGAFPELISMTNAGLLVSPGDPQALADALATLLTDPARRSQLALRGRDAVAVAFTDDHMAAKMLQVYQEVQA